MSWILVVLGISWLAVFSSQSLVDLADVFIIVTALVIAFKKCEWKSLFTSFRPALLWPIWIGIILIGIFLHTDIHSAKTWEDFFEIRWMLTFICGIYLFKNLSDEKKTIEILGILILVLNTVAFAIWLKDTSARAGGLLGSSMSFAHNIAPIFCLYAIYTLGQWSTLELKKKIFYSAIVISSGALVLITFTRGVWIGSLVALLLTTFLFNRKIFAGVITTGVIIFLVGISTSERFANRVFTKTDLETDSNQQRTALWKANWEMVKEYPFFGVGLGANKNHLRKYYDIFGYPETQRQSHAHNQYLQFWAGTGTLGFICYLSFLFIILRYAYISFRKTENKTVSHLQLGFLAAFICYMAGSLTESNFNIAKNRFLFLVLAALAIAWADELKRTKLQR